MCDAAYQFGILYIEFPFVKRNCNIIAIVLMIVWIVGRQTGLIFHLAIIVYSFAVSVRLSYYADIMKFSYKLFIYNITEFLSNILIIIHSQFAFAQLGFRVAFVNYAFKLIRAVLALAHSLLSFSRFHSAALLAITFH